MMTLEGAINFSESNNSTIYTMNSVQTGQYCVVIPKFDSFDFKIFSRYYKIWFFLC